MSNRMMRAKTIIHKFYGANCPHWTSLLLWISGTMVLVALTINDVSPLLRDYLDEDNNVAVKITVVRNGSIKQPQLQLCMPLGFGRYTQQVWKGLSRDNQNGIQATNCPVCEELEKNGWNVWKKLTGSNFEPDDANSTVTDLSVLFMNKIFDNITRALFDNATGDTMIRPIFDMEKYPVWKRVLADFSLRLFDGIFSLDITPITNTVWEDFAIYHGGNWTRYVAWNRKHGELVDALFKNVLTYFCSLIEVRDGSSRQDGLFDKPYNGSYCVNSALKTATFDEDFCFNLPQSANLLISTDYLAQESMAMIFYVFDASHKLSKRAPHWIYESRDFSSLTTKPGLNRKVEFAIIKYSIQTSVIEERVGKHCYKDETRTDCLIRCKTAAIVQECSCVPFTTRYFTERRDLLYCNFTSYNSCSQAVFGHTEECNQQCLTACDYTTYQWQVSQSPMDWNDSDPSITFLALEVEALVTPYIQFNVSVRDTSKNLISQIGGSIGFYLGLSGLSIVVLVIYCLNSVRRWRQSKEKQGSAMAFPLWNLRWLGLMNDVLARRHCQDDQSTTSGRNGQAKALEELKEKVASLEQEKGEMQQEKGEMQQKIRECLEQIEELRGIVTSIRNTTNVATMSPSS